MVAHSKHYFSAVYKDAAEIQRVSPSTKQFSRGTLILGCVTRSQAVARIADRTQLLLYSISSCFRDIAL